MTQSPIMLHDVMVGMGAYLGERYDYSMLTAILRLQPGVWCPLAPMTEAEVATLAEGLGAQDYYPHVYEARLVNGVSEVRTRVLLRKPTTTGLHYEPLQEWEVEPEKHLGQSTD